MFTSVPVLWVLFVYKFSSKINVDKNIVLYSPTFKTIKNVAKINCVEDFASSHCFQLVLLIIMCIVILPVLN